MRPSTLKQAVERILTGEDQRYPIGEFLDEFYLRHGKTTEQQAMIDEPPPLSGDRVLDAYVAAVSEHLTRRWCLPSIPAWVEDAARFLDTPYWDDDLQLMKDILLRD